LPGHYYRFFNFAGLGLCELENGGLLGITQRPVCHGALKLGTCPLLIRALRKGLRFFPFVDIR
jgi:hypothetical protein